MFRGGVGLGDNHGGFAIGAGADLLRLLTALRAELGGLPLPFGLHALIDRLAVLFREVGAADAHVDHLDAVAVGLMVELLADPRHQRFALVTHHLDEGDLAEHAAQCRVQQRGQLQIGRLDRADALVKPQGILDAVTGEGIDHQPLLIRGDHLLRGIFEIENALVDRDHGVDERRLEIQAGFGDDADRLAEPHHQHLFGLDHGEDRTVGNDQHDEQQEQRDDACNGGPHRVPPLGCWPVVPGEAGRRGVSSLKGR